MAKSQHSKVATQQRKRLVQCAEVIEYEAAKLAGVYEILANLGEISGIADSLGVVRDAVHEANVQISEAALKLRTM